jgi:hypothetical protein
MNAEGVTYMAWGSSDEIQELNLEVGCLRVTIKDLEAKNKKLRGEVRRLKAQLKLAVGVYKRDDSNV